jgi:hypothetical protein
MKINKKPFDYITDSNFRDSVLMLYEAMKDGFLYISVLEVYPKGFYNHLSVAPYSQNNGFAGWELTPSSEEGLGISLYASSLEYVIYNIMDYCGSGYTTILITISDGVGFEYFATTSDYRIRPASK